jgi:beta-galactosidase
VTYLDQVHKAHRALRELGVTTDVVAPGADLSRYKLVVIPCLYMVSDQDAEKIEQYVANGGSLLVTFFSGIVDERDLIRLGGYPGAFKDVLGVHGEEFAPLLPGREVRLSNGATGSVWTERLRTTTAETIATYTDGPLPGVPAITRNGNAWYVATELDPRGLRELTRDAVTAAGVTPAGPEANGDLEVVRRSADGRSYLFVINHGLQEVRIAGEDLVTGKQITHVEAGGVAVLREEARA